MRNIFVFWGALLLVDAGVFGVNVTLSVMKGDSVTLKPHPEIPEDDTALWKFGDEIIAKINKVAGLFSISEDDGRFKGKLDLDHQTGSLTITNISTDHTGLYKLHILGDTTSKIFIVTVGDVVKSVSVMEGDTVTLHTGVTGIQRDQIQWKFGDPGVLIADLKGPDDTRWRNEIGDLTISNIRRNQSGYYKLEINTSNMILHRKLCINFSGEMKTVSVKEGEPIFLYTGLIKIEGHDLILWKFKDFIIAEINKGSNLHLTHDTRAGGSFKGRLQLDNQSGSLTIRGSRTTDSEDYHLNMSSSSYTIQRILSVTVSGSGLSLGALAGIVVVLLVVFVAVVIYLCCKISKLQKLLYDAEKNGTNVSLKDKTANSDD